MLKGRVRPTIVPVIWVCYGFLLRHIGENLKIDQMKFAYRNTTGCFDAITPLK